jgi:hypothetical protein
VDETCRSHTKGGMSRHIMEDSEIPIFVAAVSVRSAMSQELYTCRYSVYSVLCNHDLSPYPFLSNRCMIIMRIDGTINQLYKLAKLLCSSAVCVCCGCDPGFTRVPQDFCTSDRREVIISKQ